MKDLFVRCNDWLGDKIDILLFGSPLPRRESFDSEYEYNLFLKQLEEENS